MKTPTRPVYLDLVRLHLPLPGWVSILHRVSGVLLFLALPVGAWALSASLASEAGFGQVVAAAASPAGKVLALGLVWAALFHFLAGLRHLAMDAHWGVHRVPARRSSLAVVTASTVLTLALAGCLFT